LKRDASRKGKPVERRGRKASGPKQKLGVAGLPKEVKVKGLRKQKILSLVTAFMLLTVVGASAAPLPKPANQTKSFSVLKINLPKPQLKIKIDINVKVLAQKISSVTEKKTKEMEPLKETSSKNLSYNSSSQSSTKKTSSTKSTTSKKSTTTQSSSRSSTSEQALARRILARYIARYPILRGVQVYIRECPNNWQGCAYYKQGIILIDPDHTASLERIIAHEVQHIIDWRQDHDIDNNDYHK
jgi:hypothetical protein